MKHLVPIIALVACDAGPRSTSIERRAPPSAASPAPASVGAPAPVAPISAAVELAPIDPPAVGPPPVRLEALCEPLAAATCRVHLGCRTGAVRDSLSACQVHVRAACEAERPRLEARIQAGRLRFDADALRDCAARVDMLRCGPPGDMQAELGDACEGVLVGRLAALAPCEDAGDCAPGLACMSEGACPGRCEPLRALGDPCDAELAPCAAGLSCELGRCAPAAVGLEQACVTSAQCPAGAFCDDGDVSPRCRPRRATGAACDDDEQCGEGDHCRFVVIDELLVEAGTCAPRIAEGARCEPLVGGCADGLACDEASAVCARVPDTVGQGCVADVAPCGAGTGLVCDAGLCELEPFVGDACDPSQPEGCRFGVCAATDASGVGECRAFVGPGQACASDPECGALACVGGRCGRPATRCQANLHDVNVGFRYRIR